MEFSSHHIRYLARTFLEGSRPGAHEDPTQDAVPQSSVLFRIRSVERFVPQNPRSNEELEGAYRMRDVLLGLHGALDDFLFAVVGDENDARLFLGGAASRSAPEETGDLLRAVTTGRYPGLELDGLGASEMRELSETIGAWSCLGGLTGLPAIKLQVQPEDPTQVDRLVRSMQGQDWAVLVSARSMPASFGEDMLFTARWAMSSKAHFV